jgi:hypothetical protein
MNETSSFFCDVVIPGLIQNMTSSSRRKTLKLFFIHLDNARPRNSKQSQECIQASKAKRLPHPVYSPDLASSDFFFFGYLKEKLATFHCTTRDELKSAFITIFNEIDRETLLAVFNSELERLEWVIKHGGKTSIRKKVNIYTFQLTEKRVGYGVMDPRERWFPMDRNL